MFQKVAILGSGLMGGSLALALKALESLKSPQATMPITSPVLWARRQESVDYALASGVQASTDLAIVVQDADLLVLTTPVGAMPDLLKQAIAAGLPQQALITDVGSVKKLPHQALEPLVGERIFIGSHPMVGSERSGLEASDADLYVGGACLMTVGDVDIESSVATQLEEFWQAVGCNKISWMSAQEHDDLVAKISHFPHAMAAVVAAIAMNEEEDVPLSGQGLRDTSRVASGDAAMWTEIIQENHEAILPYLEQANQQLTQLQNYLKNKDSQGLEAWLQQAKLNRDRLI